MLSKSYKGYIEGLDLSEVPLNYLCYPSINTLIHKGTAFTRPGIKNDGNAPVLNTPIIGEFVWKDALSGELALRATGTKLQLKWYGVWVTIFTGFSASALRVRFATWTDSNGAIIKRRLFMVDGSDKVYEWNGAVGTIASTAANHVTLSGTSTLQQLGFDPGNTTPQNVQIIRFSGGAVTTTDPFTASDDASTTTMTLSGTPTNVPVAGDLVIASVITNTVLSGIPKDDIYDYQNRVVLASLTGIRVYFSDVVAKLGYTVPVPASRTATSPFLIDLPGHYTAMIKRFNQSTQRSVLWISTVNIWTKVTALLDQDNFGNWVDVQEFAQSEHLGAYPFAVADFKGDPIFLAQDNTLQRIQTIDVLAKDSLAIISDEVEDLLKRLNPSEVRIYYYSRYIFICYPAVSTTIMLDMVEGHFQPPQTLPMGHMSVIGGLQYGHSNVRDETFRLFTGRNDLGSPIQGVFAFGFYQGYQRASRSTHVTQDFFLKSHTKLAVSCRMTKATAVNVVQYMENNGVKVKFPFRINGRTVRMYKIPDDETWASHLWGDSSIGAGDTPSTDLVDDPYNDPNNELGKVYAFKKNNATSWFEHRVIITVNPVEGASDQEFHLLAWYMDDAPSTRNVPEELFIAVSD